MTEVLRRLLRLGAVCAAVGMKKTQIYEAMARGTFPRPVPVLENGKAVGWVEDEIADFIEARIKLRDEAAAQKPPTEPKRGRGRPRKTQEAASPP